MIVLNSVQRVDSWGDQDDQMLARIVLKHIREGSTKKKAFEEAGNELERTVHACAFRWNNVLKERYESAVHLSKKAREAIMKQRGRIKVIEKNIPVSSVSVETPHQAAPIEKETTSPSLLDQLSAFLQEHEEIKKQIDVLKQENAALKAQLEQTENVKTKLEHNQKTMMDIMERMKQLTFPDELLAQ